MQKLKNLLQRTKLVDILLFNSSSMGEFVSIY